MECTICRKSFQNSECICSTSCGHIFHHSCLRNWQAEYSTNCPQCQQENTTHHEIYLNFDNSSENSSSELNVKLESALEKINELCEVKQDYEMRYLQLEEQYMISQELIKKLEERLLLNGCETNPLHVKEQYSQPDVVIRKLQEENKNLIVENESKSNELTLKSVQVAILKQKMEYLYTEFEKEIQNSTQLSINNENLYEQNMESAEIIQKLQEEIQDLIIENERKSK